MVFGGFWPPGPKKSSPPSNSAYFGGRRAPGNEFQRFNAKLRNKSSSPSTPCTYNKEKDWSDMKNIRYNKAPQGDKSEGIF